MLCLAVAQQYRSVWFSHFQFPLRSFFFRRRKYVFIRPTFAKALFSPFVLIVEPAVKHLTGPWIRSRTALTLLLANLTGLVLACSQAARSYAVTTKPLLELDNLFHIVTYGIQCSNFKEFRNTVGDWLAGGRVSECKLVKLDEFP